jgi:stage II sporulation protein AA (anti-sigma F factor antagonist)
MDIQQSTQGNVVLLAAAGRIDTTTSGALDDALRRALEAGARNVVVDLSDVEYISSAGLRVLLVLAKRLRDLRGRLVLCAMSEPVKQVFELAGFMPLFTIEPSRESAAARCSAPA